FAASKMLIELPDRELILDNPRTIWLSNGYPAAPNLEIAVELSSESLALLVQLFTSGDLFPIVLEFDGGEAHANAFVRSIDVRDAHEACGPCVQAYFVVRGG